MIYNFKHGASTFLYAFFIMVFLCTILCLFFYLLNKYIQISNLYFFLQLCNVIKFYNSPKFWVEFFLIFYFSVFGTVFWFCYMALSLSYGNDDYYTDCSIQLKVDSKLDRKMMEDVPSKKNVKKYRNIL